MSSLLSVSEATGVMVISPGLHSIPVLNPTLCRLKLREDEMVEDTILRNDLGVKMGSIYDSPGMHHMKQCTDGLACSDGVSL